MKRPLKIELDSFDLMAAERRLIMEALGRTATLVDAAGLLGVTIWSLMRRMERHQIVVPRIDQIKEM